MADTNKPSPKVREFALYELERIAKTALAKAPDCVKGRGVDIERLLDAHGVKLVAFQDLARQWKTYAFIDTKSRFVFVDAELMDNVFEAKKYRFTLAEELAHLLIHTGLFAGCDNMQARMAIEDALGEERRDRLENNAKALAAMILMPEQSVHEFIKGAIPKFTDAQGNVRIEPLANAMTHEFDVNFRPAKRRLKVLGYHRTHGWNLN